MPIRQSVRLKKPLSALRNDAYFGLSQYFSASKLESVWRCAVKLQNALPYQSHLRKNRVLVAYGGGKDSSYMVAFVRMLQLVLFKERGETFQMRVATNRHAGMPKAVTENIHRVYSALQLYDDPDVELLLIDGNEVNKFDRHRPLPDAVIERNRQDILMTGHRTQANARPTFCNACNLSMINSFAVASGYTDGVDAIVTGDSPKEQRAYTVWVNRLAQQAIASSRPQQRGFGGFLKTIAALSQSYFREIYGQNADSEVAARTTLSDNLLREPSFFSIYDDTNYSAGDHWELLTDFLGFEFDDLAFSFSESDCGNPALMAHLRGLKCERVYGRSYAEGIEEYVRFATDLMRRKQFPEVLIEQMKKRYATEDAVRLMREKVNAFALEHFRITEKQLICMVYAPFAERGKNLEMYLSKEQPHLLPYLNEIRRFLEQTNSEEMSLQSRGLAYYLWQISGLNLEQLRVCYASSLLGEDSNSESGLLDLILKLDPHKAEIATRQSQNGPIVSEVISGR